VSQTQAAERRQDGAPVAGSGREGTLLVIAYFFPPLGGGGVQRTVKFLKYLRPLGWRAEVVTVRSRDYWVIDRSLADDVPSDTVVHRTHALTGLGLLALAGRHRPGVSEESAAPDAAAPPPARSSSAFRWLRRLSSFFLVPDAYVGWFPFALAAARARLNQGQIDVLLTTSSPDTAHLVGLVLRERLPVPWVADFRDPWVRRLTFEAPTGLHHRLHLWLERRVLERADLVLVTNEATRDDFLERHPGIPEERFAVIPNGYDPEDLAAMREISLTPGQARRESAKGDRRFVLAHTGLLSGKRTLAPLIDGIERLLAEHPELRRRFLLRQVGPRESVNDQLVSAAGLEDCVAFLPPTGHRQILAEMAAADALLLIESAEPAGRLITPGKIFEYLASGRPILALVPEGPAADLVRAAAAGEVVAPGDAAGIAAVLARWLGEEPPAPPVRDEVLAPYARPALAARLASLLDELARAGTGSFHPW
jgi:glycosyltransferase involved in cell wall biosynthesis